MNQLPIDHEYPPELDDHHLNNRFNAYSALAGYHRDMGHTALEKYFRDLANRDWGELALRGVVQTESLGDIN